MCSVSLGRTLMGYVILDDYADYADMHHEHEYMQTVLLQLLNQIRVPLLFPIIFLHVLLSSSFRASRRLLFMPSTAG